MKAVQRSITVVWGFVVKVVWGSTPAQHDQRAGRQALSEASIEQERARQRAASTTSMMGGGL